MNAPELVVQVSHTENDIAIIPRLLTEVDFAKEAVDSTKYAVQM